MKLSRQTLWTWLVAYVLFFAFFTYGWLAMRSILVSFGTIDVQMLWMSMLEPGLILDGVKDVITGVDHPYSFVFIVGGASLFWTIAVVVTLKGIRWAVRKLSKKIETA
jgi:hypothetical protein